MWLEGCNTSPVLVEISPTGYCNASCPWCFFKAKHDGEQINKYTMLKALKSMREIGVLAVNWTGGGEPTLHPDFNSFTKLANDLGLQQGLFTNAYKVIHNPERFEWIRISLTDKGYDPIIVPDAPFGICFNLTKTNTADELEELCIRAKNIGASYFQVRPALEGHYSKQPFLVPPIELRKHNTNDFKVLLTEYKFIDARKPHGYDRCYGGQFCSSIDWNGNLGMCMYRTGEDGYILGDLNKHDFKELWRMTPEDGCEVNDGCQNCCKNHEINKALYLCKHVRQVNFL
jgi:organic radical activating enzyme